jgi:catechol 2,3-dioxygenase-like lactoylglutathione lyase family enzyme
MKKFSYLFLGFALSFTLGFVIKDRSSHLYEASVQKNETMKLGAFSLSLSVENLAESKAFYEKLGFDILGGGMEMNYLIMKNENSLIGLFQGMFEGNMLTFNPGWDEKGKNTESYDDIRYIQKELNSSDINTGAMIDPESSGPASIFLTDPDGNLILIDQHR